MLDIDAMIAQLRGQIEALEAEVLSLERVKEAAQARGFYGPKPGSKPHSLAVGTSMVRPGGRRDELRDFLRRHGPMKAADLVKESGIPKGTIDTLLNERDNFVSLGNGTWTVQESGEDEAPEGESASAPHSKSDTIRERAQEVLLSSGEPMTARMITAALQERYGKSSTVEVVRKTLRKLANAGQVFTRTKNGHYGLIEWKVAAEPGT